MDMQRELLYDEDINRLGVTPGYYSQPQQVLAMLRVMDRMFMLTNSSSLVSEASFLAPSIGKTITAGGWRSCPRRTSSAPTTFASTRLRRLLRWMASSTS